MRVIDSADVGYVWTALQKLTIQPLKEIVSSLIPWLSAYAWYTKVDPEDSSQGHLRIFAQNISKEVTALCNAADLSRIPDLYLSVNQTCSSFGGIFSLAKPLIVIPSFWLNTHPDSKKNVFNPLFSDRHIRFFLAREIAHLKNNTHMWSTLRKVIIIAAATALMMSSLHPVIISTILVGLVIFQFISDQWGERMIDHMAAEIVAKSLNKPPEAGYEIAISALRESQESNKERREKSFCSKLFITKQGDHRLDLSNHSLSSRIQRLSQRL